MDVECGEFELMSGIPADRCSNNCRPVKKSRVEGAATFQGLHARATPVHTSQIPEETSPCEPRGHATLPAFCEVRDVESIEFTSAERPAITLPLALVDVSAPTHAVTIVLGKTSNRVTHGPVIDAHTSIMEVLPHLLNEVADMVDRKRDIPTAFALLHTNRRFRSAIRRCPLLYRPARAAFSSRTPALHATLIEDRWFAGSHSTAWISWMSHMLSLKGHALHATLMRSDCALPVTYIIPVDVALMTLEVSCQHDSVHWVSHVYETVAEARALMNDLRYSSFAEAAVQNKAVAIQAWMVPLKLWRLRLAWFKKAWTSGDHQVASHMLLHSSVPGPRSYDGVLRYLRQVDSCSLSETLIEWISDKQEGSRARALAAGRR